MNIKNSERSEANSELRTPNSELKRLGVLTSGGDAPGMNACLRAVVRTATSKGCQVWGFERGYEGLLDKMYIKLTSRHVSGIINLGGTILKTGRCPRFFEKKYVREAAGFLKEQDIYGLVVIGGNGSYQGAISLQEEGVRIVGAPGTIDNDITGTDRTIGCDTAIETAISAIDKIRDTATSFDRIFVVEVMGRDSSYIALQTAVSSGAEEVVLPGEPCNINNMVNRIKSAYKTGKRSWIIIVAEGAGSGVKIAETIQKYTGFDVRATILGHIQRGGVPTCEDRVVASVLGRAAVDSLLSAKTGVAVGTSCDRVNFTDLKEAVKPKHTKDEVLHSLVYELS